MVVKQLILAAQLRFLQAFYNFLSLYLYFNFPKSKISKFDLKK